MFKRCVSLFILLGMLAVSVSCGGDVAATQAPSVPDESSSIVESVEEVEVEMEEEPVSELPTFTSVADLYLAAEEWLGEEIRVEGFYADDTISFLLDDIDDFVNNAMMPINELLVLMQDPGALIIPPQESGAYVRVEGQLLPYSDEYPQVLEDNGQFLMLDVYAYEVIEPSIWNIPKDELPQIVSDQDYEFQGCLWVLVVSGSPYTFPGTNLTAVNHSRYWNDALFAYQTALRLGAQWVRVLYANGAAPPAFFGRLPGNIPAANLAAATRMNLTAALATIGQTMPGDCQLWIITTDHGVGWIAPNKIGFGPGNNYLQSVLGRIDGAPADAIVPEGDLFVGDENLPAAIGVGNVVNNDMGDDVDEGLVLAGSIIYDDSFSAELDANVNAVLDMNGIPYEIYVMMEQCFSGGFIADLPPAMVVNIATACSEDQLSYGMGWPVFDEFLYYFISALNQADPWGGANPGPVIDVNGDGIVDWTEAYNYAQFMDTAPENPQFR